MLHSVLTFLYCTEYDMDMYRSYSFTSATYTWSFPFFKQGRPPRASSQTLSTPLPSISTSQIPISRSQLGGGYDADVGYFRRVCRFGRGVRMLPPLCVFVSSISDCISSLSSTTRAGEAEQNPECYHESDQADYAKCNDDG
jgi:hypothetical protein